MNADTIVETLNSLVENLATQDNACTRDPIFIVQQKRLADGLDPGLGDETLWLVPECDGLYEMDDALEALEIDAPEGQQYEALLAAGAEETGVAVVWEYVSTHFTRSAAERYIEENAHRMVESRVYVGSQYRCPEWNAVRAVLLAARDKPDALERFVRDILAP